MSSLAPDVSKNYFPNRLGFSFLHGVQIEAYGLRCGKMLWIIVFLPALLVALQLLISKVMLVAELLEQGGTLQVEAADLKDNAYGYLTDSLLLGFKIINLLLAGCCAYSFANERDTGSVRHIVIRGVSRVQLLLAKYFLLLMSACLSVVIMILCAGLMCSLLFSFGPVVEEGFELIGVAEIHAELIKGVQLALLPLPASIAFALLVSVVARNATQAVALALGITLGLDLLKTAMGELAWWYYGFYQPALVDHSYLSEVAKIVRGFSDVLVNNQQINFNYWLPLVQLAILLGLALLCVKRREL